MPDHIHVWRTHPHPRMGGVALETCLRCHEINWDDFDQVVRTIATEVGNRVAALLKDKLGAILNDDKETP